MTDIKHKTCITCNKVKANFNYKYAEKALFCKSCKLENMVDIKSKNVSHVILKYHISIIKMKKKHYIVLHVN